MGTWLPDLWKFVARRTAKAWSRGDPQRAIEIASRYARRRPHDYKAWELWAGFVNHAGDRPKAESILREGLIANPGRPELLAQLADFLSSGCSGPEDQHWIEAGKLLEQARQRAPENPEVLLALLGRETFGLNFDEMRRLARLTRSRISFDDFHDRSLAFQLAQEMLSINGMSADAIGVLERLVAESPTDRMSNVHLGVLLEKDNPDRAKDHLNRARQSWPRYAHESFEQTMEAIRCTLREAEEDEQ